MQINLEQYIDNVFRFALTLTSDRHLAEDLTQECFLRAHMRKKQLNNHAASRSWLFQILINLWKDHLKKKRIEPDESLELDFVPSGMPPQEAFVQQEQCKQIIGMMQSLPERQRAVLFLSAVERLTNREIAELLEASENTIKANLSIARKTMRKKILKQTQPTPVNQQK